MVGGFDKFSTRARSVLSHAQEEARRLNHDFIGAEHILLGISKEPDSVAAKVLTKLERQPGEVRSSVEATLRPMNKTSGGEVQLMPRARRIIELAVDEALELDHDYIGTEHLLIGLIREGQGVAAGLLENLGVDLDRVRAETIRILADEGPPSEAVGQSESFKQIIKMALEEYLEELGKALDGLTPEERRFQPTPEAHHIDFAVWHMARVEDDWVQRFARQTDSVWIQEGWHDKLGLPEKDSGFGYDAEQVANLPAFNFDDLMAYYDSVRTATLGYLDDLAEETLEVCPQPARRPGYSIGKMFSHVIVEESQHVGQVAYLRGLQRGINK